jgi:hypothetical protein
MATQATGSKKNDTADDAINAVDTDKLKKEADTTIDNVKAAGSELLTNAKAALADKASTAVEEKKAAFTGGLTSVADSIRRFSGSLNEAEPNPLTEYSAKYAETAASKVEDVARYFENADFKTVSRDVESFARRNPAVFVGGAFALGILLARFMKSSSEAAARQQGDGSSGRRRSSSRATKGTSGGTGTRAAA